MNSQEPYIIRIFHRHDTSFPWRQRDKRLLQSAGHQNLVRRWGLLRFVPRFTKKARAKWRSEARSDPEAVEVLKNLGERIRVLRTEKQLSQEKAAEQAGLSPQHLVDIDHDRTNARTRR